MADELKNENESTTAARSEMMSCPMCGSSPTGAMGSGGPMAMMQKMPTMCMAFMVVTPVLLGVAVGLMIGRSTARSR